MNDDLTADEVRDLFDYDPRSGNLIWRRRGRNDPATRTWDARFAGKAAGSSYGDYLTIGIGDRNYRAHRLVWLHNYGTWPTKHLDHIDGDGRNNRISNLREATPAENNQNIGKVRSNTTGLPGALFRKSDGKWWSTIRANGQRHFLGTYPTKEAAHIAYVEAKKLLHTFNPTIRGFSKPSSR